MAAMSAYAVAFLLCALTTGFFWNALRGPYMGGYSLAALASLFLLSGSGSVLFALLLAARGGQMLKPEANFWLGRFSRHLTADREPLRGSLPQSEFARQWRLRKTASYEESRWQSRTQGDQIPYRLACAQINRRKSRALWPTERYLNFRNRYKS
ncbi:MAG: hypothetical protein K8J31_17215 [Anaerolineae bacterium]|nr:hypothetical protein [Anaerolineae bacterium]